MANNMFDKEKTDQIPMEVMQRIADELVRPDNALRNSTSTIDKMSQDEFDSMDWDVIKTLVRELVAKRETSAKGNRRNIQTLPPISIDKALSLLQEEPSVPEQNFGEEEIGPQLQKVLTDAFRRMQDAVAAKARVTNQAQRLAIGKTQHIDTTQLQSQFDTAVQQYKSVLQSLRENDAPVARAISSELKSGDINADLARRLSSVFSHVPKAHPVRTPSGQVLDVAEGAATTDALFAEAEKRATKNVAALYEKANRREDAETRTSFDSGTRTVSVEEQIAEGIRIQPKTRRQRQEYNNAENVADVGTVVRKAKEELANPVRLREMSSADALKNEILAGLLTEEEITDTRPAAQSLREKAAMTVKEINRIYGLHSKDGTPASVLNQLDVSPKKTPVAEEDQDPAGTKAGDIQRLYELAIQSNVGRTRLSAHYVATREALKDRGTVYDDQVLGYSELRKKIGNRYFDTAARPPAPTLIETEGETPYYLDEEDKKKLGYMPSRPQTRAPSPLPTFDKTDLHGKVLGTQDIFDRNYDLKDQIDQLKTETDLRDRGTELVRKEEGITSSDGTSSAAGTHHYWETEGQGTQEQIDKLNRELAENKQKIDEYVGNLLSFINTLSGAISKAKGDGDTETVDKFSGVLEAAKARYKQVKNGIFRYAVPKKPEYDASGINPEEGVDPAVVNDDLARTRNILGIGSKDSLASLQKELIDQNATAFHLKTGVKISDRYFEELQNLRNSSDQKAAAELLIGGSSRGRFVYSDYAAQLGRTSNPTLNRVANNIRQNNLTDDFSTVSTGMTNISDELRVVVDPESTQEQINKALDNIDKITAFIAEAKARVNAFILGTLAPKLEERSALTEISIAQKERATIRSSVDSVTSGIPHPVDTERKDAVDQVLHQKLTPANRFNILNSGTGVVRLDSMKLGGVEVKSEVDKTVPEDFVDMRIDDVLSSGASSIDTPVRIKKPLKLAYQMLLAQSTGKARQKNGAGNYLDTRDTAENPEFIHVSNPDIVKTGSINDNVAKVIAREARVGSFEQDRDPQRIFDTLDDFFLNDPSSLSLQARGDVLSLDGKNGAYERAAVNKELFAQVSKKYQDISKFINAWLHRDPTDTNMSLFKELEKQGVDVKETIDLLSNPGDLVQLSENLSDAQGGKDAQGNTYEGRLLAELKKEENALPLVSNISTSEKGSMTGNATSPGQSAAIPSYTLAPSDNTGNTTSSSEPKHYENGIDSERYSKGIVPARGESPEYNTHDGQMYLARTAEVGDIFGDMEPGKDLKGKVLSIIRSFKRLPSGGFETMYNDVDAETGKSIPDTDTVVTKNYVNGMPRERIVGKSKMDWKNANYYGKEQPVFPGYERAVQANLNVEYPPGEDPEDLMKDFAVNPDMLVDAKKELNEKKLRDEMAARASASSPPGNDTKIMPNKWENNLFTNNRFVNNNSEGGNAGVSDPSSVSFVPPYPAYNPAAGLPGSRGDLINQLATDLLGFDINRHSDLLSDPVSRDVVMNSHVGNYTIRRPGMQDDTSVEALNLDLQGDIGKQTEALGRYMGGHNPSRMDVGTGLDWEVNMLRSFQSGDMDMFAQIIQSQLNGIADPLIQKYFYTIKRLVTEKLGAMFNTEQLNGARSFYITPTEAKEIPMILNGLLEKQLPQYRASGNKPDVLSTSGISRDVGTLSSISDFKAEDVVKVGETADGGEVNTFDMMGPKQYQDGNYTLSESEKETLRQNAVKKFAPQIIMENARYRQNWMKNTTGIWEMSYATKGLLQGIFGFGEGSGALVTQGLNIARSTMYTGSTVIDALRSQAQNRLLKDPRMQQAAAYKMEADSMDVLATDNRQNRASENDSYQDARLKLRDQLVTQNPTRTMIGDFVYVMDKNHNQVADESANAQLRTLATEENVKKQTSDEELVAIRKRQSSLREDAKVAETEAKAGASGVATFFSKYGNEISIAVMAAMAIPQVIQAVDEEIKKKNELNRATVKLGEEFRAADQNVSGFATTIKTMDQLMTAVAKVDTKFADLTMGMDDFQKYIAARAQIENVEGATKTTPIKTLAEALGSDPGKGAARDFYYRAQVPYINEVGHSVMGDKWSDANGTATSVNEAIEKLLGEKNLTTKQREMLIKLQQTNFMADAGPSYADSRLNTLLDPLSNITSESVDNANKTGENTSPIDQLALQRAQVQNLEDILGEQKNMNRGIADLQTSAKMTAFATLLMESEQQKTTDAFKYPSQFEAWSKDPKTRRGLDLSNAWGSLGDLGTDMRANVDDLAKTEYSDLRGKFDLATQPGRKGEVIAKLTPQYGSKMATEMAGELASGDIIGYIQSYESYQLDKTSSNILPEANAKTSQQLKDALVQIKKDKNADMAVNGGAWAYNQWKVFDPLVLKHGTEMTVNPMTGKSESIADYDREIKASAKKGLEAMQERDIKQLGVLNKEKAQGTKDWDDLNKQINDTTTKLAELADATNLVSTWFNISGSIVHPTKSMIENNVYPNLTVYVDGVKTDARVTVSPVTSTKALKTATGGSPTIGY